MNTHQINDLIDDECEVLLALTGPLAGQRLIELGCGAARLARELLARFPDADITGLEVDTRQHAKNLADPQPGLHFVQAGAQAIPFEAGQFDGALMLKSLHHVPLAEMAQALDEVARVLRPGGWLYISEPVYDGPLNDIVRLYNDEGTVRAAAQAAVDAALRTGRWSQAAERRFEMPVHYPDFATFEQRMMRPTFADHHIDAAKLAEVQAAFTPHLRADGSGAHFTRPLHVRWLRRAD